MTACVQQIPLIDPEASLPVVFFSDTLRRKLSERLKEITNVFTGTDGAERWILILIFSHRGPNRLVAGPAWSSLLDEPTGLDPTNLEDISARLTDFATAWLRIEAHFRAAGYAV